MGDWFFTLTGIYSIEDPPIWFPLVLNSDGLTRVTWFSLLIGAGVLLWRLL